MRLKKFIHLNIARLEVKADLPGEYPAGYIEGYASVFDNADNGREIVVKGAFAKTLKERLKIGFIKLMDNHQVWGGTDSVIGLIVEAKEDDYGLWFRAKLSATAKAQEIRTKLQEGILNALSFGYDVVRHECDDEKKIRYLKELKLYEVSVVVWGMNDKAAVTAAKGDAAGEPLPEASFIQGAPELEDEAPLEPEVKVLPIPPVVDPVIEVAETLADPADFKALLLSMQATTFVHDMKTSMRVRGS